MKRAIPGLLVLLVIQAAVVAATYWPNLVPGRPTTAASAPQPDPAAVTALTISAAGGAVASLVKTGERWRLPAFHDLPADTRKAEKLIGAMLAPASEWPVANSNAARQRFEVADYRFRRRIDLFANDAPLQTTYLGTSPGFRKVHARVDGQDDIRSITFNVHDAPAFDGAWIEPRLLQVRAPMRIDADAYSLQRDGGEWRTGAGGIPDERELQALLSTLRSLQVEGIADPAQVTRLAEAEAELVLDIHSLSGQRKLSLFRQQGQHFVHSSEFPVIFRISAYDFDRLTGIDFSLLSGQSDENAR